MRSKSPLTTIPAVGALDVEVLDARFQQLAFLILALHFQDVDLGGRRLSGGDVDVARLARPVVIGHNAGQFHAEFAAVHLGKRLIGFDDVARTNQALLEHSGERSDHVPLFHGLDDAVAADSVGPEREAKQDDRRGGDPERLALEEPPLADQSPDGVDLPVLEQLQRDVPTGAADDAREPFGARAGVGGFESPEYPGADHVAVGSRATGRCTPCLRR